MRTLKPTKPRPGPLPIICYSYDEGRHTITCECGSACSTTEELTARNFASQHTGLHARNRIVTPSEVAS